MAADVPSFRTQEDLAEDAVALLKDYLREPRTSVLRRLAEVIVDLRSKFRLADGRTDWSGRSHDYRAVIGDVYTRAGVQKESADRLQGAMRYHIGNLIRERVDKAELLAVGLTSTSPRDRNAATREALTAMTAVAGGAPPRTEVDRLSVYAQALLTVIDETAILSLEDDRAAVSRLALEAARVRIDELLAAHERRGKRPRRGGRSADLKVV